MKKRYESPQLSSIFVPKEDVLSISANEGHLAEEEIQGAMWVG